MSTVDSGKVTIAISRTLDFTRPRGFQPDPCGRLDRLGLAHGTDKASNGHGYCHIYEGFLREEREAVSSVLEIGIAFGASLAMWADYFPNAIVHGVDIIAVPPAHPRIRTAVIDVRDVEKLRSMALACGPFDLIVDDGSHKMADQQDALFTLWPFLRLGGFYFLEDLHTSFYGAQFGVNEQGSNTTLGVIDWLQGVGPVPQLVGRDVVAAQQVRRQGRAMIFKGSDVGLTAVIEKRWDG